MQQAKNIDIYSLKDSPKWLGLSMQSKVLISLLQIDWRIDRPVPYSVSEAMNKIPCARGTAQRAFKELEEAGFIVSCGFKMDEVKKIKSRHWMLTWLPYQNDGPTNNWDQKAVEHDGSELKNNLPIDGLRDIDYRSLLYKYIKLKITQTLNHLLGTGLTGRQKEYYLLKSLLLGCLLRSQDSKDNKALRLRTRYGGFFMGKINGSQIIFYKHSGENQAAKNIN